MTGKNFVLLEMPRLGLASFRRRILVRVVFLLLAVATIALALVLLKEEKERSYQNYQQGFQKTRSEMLARLRHPSGLLALLNPSAQGSPVTPLRPLLLPYAALDFDDHNKAQQAVETAGCSVRYPDDSTICAAIGNNPYSGGFIYLVGSFASTELVPRDAGMLDLTAVHRASVTLTMRGKTAKWIAPFELLSDGTSGALVGRLTAFGDNGELLLAADAKPLREFRGWLWQGGGCADGSETTPTCPRRAYFSLRLPSEGLRESLFGRQRPVWPPPDLDRIQVRMQFFAPDSDKPLFDSNAPGAETPTSLHELRKALLPGETLTVRRAGATREPPLVFKGEDAGNSVSSPLIARLIRRLPLADVAVSTPAPTRDVLTTPVGNYEVILAGDVRGIERGLGIAATRMSWYVAAMLAAIIIAWLLIEIGLMRRIKVLTKRAAAVSQNVLDDKVDQRIARMDFNDLRGADELGILAGGLADLVDRVKDDVRREQLRAQQERDMLQAVGHEILSPLQSLMVLHPNADDAGRRYVQRMQQAVRVLYGQASPSEALQAANLELGTLDLDEFLRHVAGNAHFAGIADVHYEREASPVTVRADEFSLEDVITHVLKNADRHRGVGTAIEISLEVGDAVATVVIRNEGPRIEEGMLERIFEYGVSATMPPPYPPPEGEGKNMQRGQGLFVARTYMGKMGGTIEARNEADGVSLVLVLQRAA